MHVTKVIVFVAVVFSTCIAQTHAQKRKYSVANAHAHNDYNHPLPFYTAYNAGFGSMEADIFLHEGGLFVAHDSAGLASRKTLQSLYLEPLQKAIQKNNGFVYADRTKSLLLLIDLKTPALPTLEALLQVLQSYKTLTDCSGLKLVITGNRPDISALTSYPSYLYFDGDPNKNYSPEALDKVALFSENFRNYTKWAGEGIPPDSAQAKLETIIAKAHGLNKPIRFWAAPDAMNTWRQLLNLGVDYINTDKISGLADFLNKQAVGSSKRK